jgi:hypothetical protein
MQTVSYIRSSGVRLRACYGLRRPDDSRGDHSEIFGEEILRGKNGEEHVTFSIASYSYLALIKYLWSYELVDDF